MAASLALFSIVKIKPKQVHPNVQAENFVQSLAAVPAPFFGLLDHDR
jgi:hypothetical protein